MDNISKKNLYVFTTSDAPDVYINTIGYCIENLSPIDKIYLLSIVKDRGLREKTAEDLERTKSKIVQQLSHLQVGKYMFFNLKAKSWQEKIIEIKEYDRRRYTKISAHDIDTKVIFYDELEANLSKFIHENGDEAIFDLSAVVKAYLIDVFVLLVELGSTHIHVFELKRDKRTHDEQELIHNLAIDKDDYKYVNLTKSPYTMGKNIVNKVHADKQSEQAEKLNLAIDLWSSTFARWMLTIGYFIALVIVFILVETALGDNWNTVERWVTILLGTPLLAYVISLGAYLLLSKELSAKPRDMYEWLKEYRRIQIVKKLNIL